MVRQFTTPALLAFCIATSGCGRSSMGEVEGAVTLDGKPLADVVVFFVPDLDQGARGPTSWSGTDAAGAYSLAEMKSGQRGVFVGKHRVVCKKPEKGSGGASKEFSVPERYQNPATTPLRFEVREGKQTIDLPLATAP